MTTPEPAWLTVSEVAEIEGVSTETIRRGIAAGKYPASRASDAPRAPWLINAVAYERQRQTHAERVAIRQRLAGMAGGYGPEGREAAVDGAAAHNEWSPDQRDAELRRETAKADREALLSTLHREMHEDPAIRQRFEQLDAEERFEAEARELAERVRRAERLRKRALELLEDEDEDEDAGED